MTTRVRYPDVVVYCDGTPVRALEVHCRTARNEVGTAAVTFPLPLDAAVVPGAVVEIHATIGEQAAIVHQGSFRGPEERGITISGKQAVARSDDWWWIMAIPYREDRAWTGPVSVKTIIRGMFEDREFGQPGKPTFVVHEFKDAAGATIELGGNADVDGGQVIVKAGTSPFQWIARVCDLFGYAMSNRYGVCRVTRMYGLPNEDPATSFTEGDEGFAYQGAVDLHNIVTWWDVRGASGNDGLGSPFAYRSFPAVVPSNPDVPFPTPRIVTDNLLVSDELCEIVRTIKEVEYSERRRLVRWSADGQPRRRPGNVVTVTSPSAGLDDPTDLWLYTVELDWDARAGLTSHFEGSFGAGEALPSGEDVCHEDVIRAAVAHVGNDTLAYYDQPVPVGTELDIGFIPSVTPTVPFTGLSFEMEIHSCNNHMLGGGTLEPSTLRLEQPAGTVVDEVALPAMRERPNLAPEWVEISCAMAGTLEGGTTAHLFVVSGNGGEDDFEVKNVVIRHCAEGDPTLPDDPITPVIPPPQPQPEPSDCDYDGVDGTAAFGASHVVRAAPWTWPAGKAYLVITGNATGLTGHTTAGGTDPLITPAQSIRFVTVGGFYPLIVPGTQDTGDPARTGTLQTGSGAFEVWVHLSPPGGPASDQVITGEVRATVLNSNESGIGEASFAVSDLCWHFQTTGVSP